MITIGARMKHLRGKQSAADFCNALQVSTSAWYRYETGERKPDAETLVKLAEQGFNPSWILTGKGSERIGGESEQSDLPWSQYVFVPRYAVTASMGGGAQVNSEQIVDYYAFRKQFLDFLGVSTKSAAVIRLRGRSMTGALEDRDTVLVDLSDRQLTIGHRDIYVLRLTDGDELFAKYVTRQPAGGLLIESSESSGIAPMQRDEHEVLVLGRVRWLGRTFL